MELLADWLHWLGTWMLIGMFSLCLVMQGCTQKRSEQGAPPTVTPREYPTWVKTFSRQDILNSIYPTADGGFIAAGRTNFRKWYHDAGIVKIDAGGNVQWQRGFGGQYQDEFFAVVQTSDNGYLATGRTINETGTWIGLLVKVNPQGAVQWQKTVPQLIFKSLLETSDGDFILTGGSTAFGASVTALVIIRLGADGQSKWQKVYGEGEGHVIRQTSDGGYIALGSVWDLGRYATLILKKDGAGTAQWQKQYGSFLNAIEQTTDGGFLLAGTVGVSDK
jgi:hypothetical protein